MPLNLFNERDTTQDDLLNIVGGTTGGQAQQPNNSAALTGLYQDVFKRAPDQSGFDYWLNAMNTQGYTPEMVRAEFMKSPEYKALTAAPAPAPAPAAATNKLAPLLAQASQQLAPQYVSSGVYGVDELTGQQAATPNYVLNDAALYAGQNFAGTFGGVPITRTGDNEYEIVVPGANQTATKYVYDVGGNLLSQNTFMTLAAIFSARTHSAPRPG